MGFVKIYTNDGRVLVVNDEGELVEIREVALQFDEIVYNGETENHIYIEGKKNGTKNNEVD